MVTEEQAQANLDFLGLDDPWREYGMWADGKVQLDEPVSTFNDWTEIERAFLEMEMAS